MRMAALPPVDDSSLFGKRVSMNPKARKRRSKTVRRKLELQAERLIKAGHSKSQHQVNAAAQSGDDDSGRNQFVKQTLNLMAAEARVRLRAEKLMSKFRKTHVDDNGARKVCGSNLCKTLYCFL